MGRLGEGIYEHGDVRVGFVCIQMVVRRDSSHEWIELLLERDMECSHTSVSAQLVTDRGVWEKVEWEMNTPGNIPCPDQYVTRNSSHIGLIRHQSPPTSNTSSITYNKITTTTARQGPPPFLLYLFSFLSCLVSIHPPHKNNRRTVNGHPLNLLITEAPVFFDED